MPAGWLERLLAAYVVLYAIQAVYSPDFEKALQQMVFFYVPFALMFCLLRRLQWTRLLLRRCVVVVGALALLFVAIGFVEYATKTLLLNPKLIAENNVHTYFAINSVFFDPDIFGRFLALVMIILRRGARVRPPPARPARRSGRARGAVGGSGADAVAFEPGRAAGRAGHARGDALEGEADPAGDGRGGRDRNRGGRDLPEDVRAQPGLNGASSGRGGLVSGGLRLFGDRPLWGYGSGSFQVEYKRLKPATSQTLSASHTIPVTIAAEQGLIGELPLLALVVVAGLMLVRGAGETRLARRSQPRSSRSCSTRCCTPTSSRIR